MEEIDAHGQKEVEEVSVKEEPADHHFDLQFMFGMEESSGSNIERQTSKQQPVKRKHSIFENESENEDHNEEEDSTIYKRPRAKISMEQKFDIVQRKESGQKNAIICREMGLRESTVRSVLKMADRIKATMKVMPRSVSEKNRLTITSVSGMRMENMLSWWISDLSSFDSYVSISAIQKKALSLMKDIDSESNSVSRFHASHGWYAKFRERFNIKKQRLPDNGETIEYQSELSEMIEENEYTAKQIFSIDKCSMWTNFECGMSDQNSAEENFDYFTTTDDRATLLLGSNIEGSCKLKPVFIYHDEHLISPEEKIEENLLPVHWYYQRRNLLTATIFSLYFKDKLHAELKAYCEKEHIPFKILLILDHACSPLLTNVHETENIKVIVLPANVKSPLRPTNQGVFSIFKAYFLRLCLSSAIRATPENNVSVDEYWQSLSVRDAIFLMRQSWDSIPGKYLNNMWKLLCPRFVKNADNVHATGAFNNANSQSTTLANVLGFSDIEQEDIEQIMESYHKELSNKDLFELEEDAMKASKLTSATGVKSCPGSRQVLSRKVLDEALKRIKSGLALLQENDPKLERSNSVSNRVMKNIFCYTKLLQKPKKIDGSSLQPCSVKKSSETKNAGHESDLNDPLS